MLRKKGGQRYLCVDNKQPWLVFWWYRLQLHNFVHFEHMAHHTRSRFTVVECVCVYECASHWKIYKQRKVQVSKFIHLSSLLWIWNSYLWIHFQNEMIRCAIVFSQNMAVFTFRSTWRLATGSVVLDKNVSTRNRFVRSLVSNKRQRKAKGFSS